MIFDGQIMTHGAHSFRVNIERDDDLGAPWEEHEGHGPVSEWTTRDKKAGERVLSSDRSIKRFYDIAAATKTARAEWSISDAKRTEIEAKLGRAMTNGEIAAHAVESDFEYLKAWCEDRWYWVGVVVTHIGPDDDSDKTPDYGHALWGLESEDDEYIEDCALDLIRQYADELDSEATERAYWEARDTVTA